MSITEESNFARRLLSRKRIVATGRQIGRFAGYTLKRFADDGCARQAAGLGYVSLLSLVPLMAIALGVLAAFPAFSQVREDLQRMVFEFLPSTGSSVTEQLTTFVESASKATGPGVIGFAVTAILLLNNIDQALNFIWRVKEPRSLALRVLVYWAMLSLGPLLLGASISMSSVAFTRAQELGIDDSAGFIVSFSRLISLALGTIGFTLIYFVVPNRQVRIANALVGGFFTALVFEILKIIFGLYLEYFPSYQAIYGAMAAVPIFLLWLYLFWTIILLGAEITAALPEWRAAQARGRPANGPGDELALLLTIIERLRSRRHKGGVMRNRDLFHLLPATPTEIDHALRDLRRAKIVERSNDGRWLLSRDPSTLTLGELMEKLNLALVPGDGWDEGATATIRGLAASGEDYLNMTLEALLAREDRPEEAE